jgi:hypothetical protein
MNELHSKRKSFKPDVNSEVRLSIPFVNPKTIPNKSSEEKINTVRKNLMTEIPRIFVYHKLTTKGFSELNRVHNKMSKAVYEVMDLLPEGREKSIFAAKIEEAMFFAKKSLASKKANCAEAFCSDLNEIYCDDDEEIDEKNNGLPKPPTPSNNGG